MWECADGSNSNVQDNSSVGYQVFLRALHSFANTEFRFGR